MKIIQKKARKKGRHTIVAQRESEQQGIKFKLKYINKYIPQKWIKCYN